MLEVGKWAEALDSLSRAKAIYQKISQFRDQIEAVIYQERIEQLDTFMRLASTKMKKGQQASKDSEPAAIAALQAEVEKAHKATRQEKIENIEEVTFGSKSIPLKSERLKQTFKKVESQSATITQLEKDLFDAKSAKKSDAAVQGISGELIKQYLKLADIIDDSQLIIKKEKVEESKKSEQSGSLFNLLLHYTQKLKLKAQIDRNLLQARQLA